jgi:hypothetical protein
MVEIKNQLFPHLVYYKVLTVSRSPNVAEPEAAPFAPILASGLASR